MKYQTIIIDALHDEKHRIGKPYRGKTTHNNAGCLIPDVAEVQPYSMISITRENIVSDENLLSVTTSKHPPVTFVHRSDGDATSFFS